MNGAQALIQTLVNGDVDVCFMNPGTSEMHFVGLARKLLKPVLTPQEHMTLLTTDHVFETLIMAREMLTDHRLEALLAPRRSQLRKALRRIEIALYATHNAKHIKQLDETFKLIFDTIRAAHERHCTCSSSSERR